MRAKQYTAQRSAQKTIKNPLSAGFIYFSIYCKCAVSFTVNAVIYHTATCKPPNLDILFSMLKKSA